MRPTGKSPTKVFQSVFDCYENNRRMLVHSGGTSCFAPGTMIVCENGMKPIEDIRIGDTVKCYDEANKRDVYQVVTDTHCFNNDKKTIRVKLKNGNYITATEDHKFYYKGGWYSLKHIVSLVSQHKIK